MNNEKNLDEMINNDDNTLDDSFETRPLITILKIFTIEDNYFIIMLY